MKKSLILKLFVAGVLAFSARSSFAQWPTLDITSIKTMIGSNSEETEQTTQTTEKTALEAENLAATGAPSKTLISEDDAAKAEKARKKAERAKKRAEWLQKKKKQYEDLKKRYDDTKKKIDAAKAAYDQGMQAYQQTKEAYEQGMAAANALKEGDLEGAVAAGQAAAAAGQAAAASGQSAYNQTADMKKDLQKNKSNNDDQKTTGTKSETKEKKSNFLQNVTESDAFKKGSEAFNSVSDILPEISEFAEGAWNTEDISEDEEIIEEEFLIDETEEEEAEEDATEEEQLPAEVGGVPLEETSQRRAFRKLPQENQEAAPATENSQTETPKETLQTEEVKPAQQTSSVEKIFLKFEPMAFAQMGDYKTGTDEEGTFVFSDTIANKCGMGLEDLSFENVQNCVKTWVFAMNDPDATLANEAKEEYDKALHDHVAANASKSLDGTAYAASFKKDVADKLSDKSGATTSIRDEMAFKGKVMQTNAELMMHLLETDSADLTYNSLKEVKLLTKDYYENEEAEK